MLRKYTSGAARSELVLPPSLAAAEEIKFPQLVSIGVSCSDRPSIE